MVIDDPTPRYHRYISTLRLIPQLAPMPPKRKRSNDGDDQDRDTRSKRFAYLKPQVRQISERTIKSKWTTLPEPIQDKVRDMFRALERPVIVRQQSERKRIEAQAAVQAVVKKCVIETFNPPKNTTKDIWTHYELLSSVSAKDCLGCHSHRSRRTRLSSTKRRLRSMCVPYLYNALTEADLITSVLSKRI